jgi:hypothetical protein
VIWGPPGGWLVHAAGLPPKLTHQPEQPVSIENKVGGVGVAVANDGVHAADLRRQAGRQAGAQALLGPAPAMQELLFLNSACCQGMLPDAAGGATELRLHRVPQSPL